MGSHENASNGASEGRAAVIERILAVTGDEARRVGPERVRMGEIAARANVSRASLYRYFASKEDLIRAYTMREFDELFRVLDESTSETDDFDDRLAEGLGLAIPALRRHPVFGAVLAINDRGIMRSTLQSGVAIAHARDQATERVNRAVREGHIRIDQYDISVTTELIARLVISLAETPESTARLDSAEDAREFARRYLVPLLSALSSETASR